MNKAKLLIIACFSISFILVGTPILIEKYGESIGKELKEERIYQVSLFSINTEPIFYKELYRYSIQSFHPNIILTRSFLFNGGKTGLEVGLWDLELHADSLEEYYYAMSYPGQFPERLALVFSDVELENELLNKIIEYRQEGVRVFRLTWFGLEEFDIPSHMLFGNKIWDMGYRGCVTFIGANSGHLSSRFLQEYKDMGGNIIDTKTIDSSVLLSATRKNMLNNIEFYVNETISKKNYQ
jgi:hypothetical protein